MVSHLFYYQHTLLALIWFFVMLHVTWSEPGLPTPPVPAQPKRKRSTEPKPFAGLTHKPHCALCEQAAGARAPAPPLRPAPMPPTHRRPHTVDTSMHFCPHTDCAYRGWLGLGNLRANGHPSGGPWRQFHCLGCNGYFPEHHGTIFHGKQAAVELIVRVLACLAEGLGIRAPARVFEVEPHTVLHWFVEAAEQLRAFACYFLCDLHVRQIQLDELYAVLSAVKGGELSEDEAIRRLSRSSQWVWTAMDPETKLLLVIEVAPAPWRWPSGCCIRWLSAWRPPVCPSSSPTVLRSTPPRSSRISATGSSRHAAKTKDHPPSRAGCRCPSCGMRR